MELFELIISPFIFIIEKIFLFGYSITNNYGWAIIILSFSISLLLLPVFVLIEKAKKKDDAIKSKMQHLIDEIKRCYKGQERYYYLKTLNRQFNYSPFRAMIPILSLLLQIPFFIAAYQYLEHFEPLRGVAFGFIEDLSQPDKLFGEINFLPIAMTLVNLLTAYFYTRNGDGAERKQMLIVAGIFLVLLFNLPSGLVLYWTMNNVFSFFRLFITNKEVFKFNIKEHLDNIKSDFVTLLPALKICFVLLLTFGILFQLNWAFNYNFNDIYQRIVATIGASVLITVLLFIIAIAYRTSIELNKYNAKVILKNTISKHKLTVIVIAITIFFTQLNWALINNFNDFHERVFYTILFSIVISYVFVFISKLIWNLNKITLVAYLTFLKSKAYLILLIAIIAIGTFAQINWAIKHNFDLIIVRLLGVLTSSILITYLIYFLYHHLRKKDVNSFFKSYAYEHT